MSVVVKSHCAVSETNVCRHLTKLQESALHAKRHTAHKKVTHRNLEFNHSVIVIIRQFFLMFALVLLPRTQRRSQGSRVIECRNMAVTGRTRRRFAPQRSFVRSCDFMMSKLSFLFPTRICEHCGRNSDLITHF